VQRYAVQFIQLPLHLHFFFRVFGLPDVSPVSPENLQSKNLKTPKNKKQKTSKPENLSLLFFYGWESFIFCFFVFFFIFFFAPRSAGQIIFQKPQERNSYGCNDLSFEEIKFFLPLDELQLPPTVLSFALLPCQRRPHTTYIPTLKCEVLGGT
jgi:hypothetical protein